MKTDQPRRPPQLSNATRPRRMFTVLSRTALAFFFIYASLAAGHLLMVAINAADYRLSVASYQRAGVEARWFGDESYADALQGLQARQSIPAEGLSSEADLRMRPVSPFLVSATFALFGIGLLLLVFSRYLRGDALQSIVGVLAGLSIWTGAVEYGLMIASRLLGLAKAVSWHNGHVVGQYGEYVLLKHTWGPVLVIVTYLLFLESNRCSVFLWLRRRLPLMRGAVATGRIDNFAPRTAFQYIMITWVFYVILLWAYDDTVFGVHSLFTHALFFGSLAVTGFLLLRLAQQKSLGPAIRYAIGVAIVGWTPVEIAAKWGLFSEPWLVLTPVTAVAFFGGAAVGTWLVVREARRLLAMKPEKPGPSAHAPAQ